MNKMQLCVKLAREASRSSWQEPRKYRKEYLRIRKESMQDARYWAERYANAG